MTGFINDLVGVKMAAGGSAPVCEYVAVLVDVETVLALRQVG